LGYVTTQRSVSVSRGPDSSLTIGPARLDVEPEEITQTFDEIKDRLEAEDGITTFKVVEQPFPGFVFEDTTATEFVEKGIELDAAEFYLIESRTGEDDLKQAGICFIYNGRPHTPDSHRIRMRIQWRKPEESGGGIV